MISRAPLIFLSLFAVAFASRLLVPELISGMTLYRITNVGAAVAVIVGVRRYRPSAPLAWYAFLVAVSVDPLTTLASWATMSLVGVGLPWLPTPAFIVSSLAGIYALGKFVRTRTPKWSVTAFLDSAILMTASMAMLWSLLASRPAAAESSVISNFITTLVTVALIVIVVRLATSPSNQITSMHMMLTAVVTSMTAGLSLSLFPWLIEIGNGVIDDSMNIGLAFLGASALHPTMVQLTRRVPEDLTSKRPVGVFALLAIAFLTIPATVALKTWTGGTLVDPIWLASAIVMAVLVLARLAHLLRQWQRADEIIRDREARFQLVLGTLREVVFETDNNGHWTSLTPAWADITGYDVDTSLGTAVRDYVRPAHHEALEGLFEHDQRDERRGHADRVEAAFVTTTGAERWIEIRCQKTFDANGNATGTIGTLQDIGDRHELELELRHAQKLKAVGVLAAGVAHEINTPIQFLGDNLSFLQDAYTRFSAAINDGAESPDREELEYLLDEVPTALDQSRDGVVRVATIVRAMKAFGYDGGDVAAPANLNEAVENTVTVAHSETKDVADVNLDLGSLPPVICRIGDINQVMLNLIVNAAHAVADVVGTSGQRGQITISSKLSGSDAVVSVSDTGSGIPDDVIDRIFEPFFTTKIVGRGSGQGLTLARSIVEKHGGSLEVASTSSKGTCFVMTLPVHGIEADKA